MGAIKLSRDANELQAVSESSKIDPSYSTRSITICGPLCRPITFHRQRLLHINADWFLVGLPQLAVRESLANHS